MNTAITRFLEWLIYGGPLPAGPGLPDPPGQRPQPRREAPRPVGGRLVNKATNTWEWDVTPRVHVDHNADTTLTTPEIFALEKAGLKNGPWNAALKIARVHGKTINEAAREAGCSPSYAGKVYGVLSRFK